MWNLKTQSRWRLLYSWVTVLLACEQASRLGKTKRSWSRREKWPSGGWGGEKSAKPVDFDYVPPFQGTRCALDSSASCDWSEDWLLTGAIVIPILRNPPTDASYLHIARFENVASEEENDLFKRALSDSLRHFVNIAQLEVEPNHIVAYTTREIVNRSACERWIHLNHAR